MPPPYRKPHWPTFAAIPYVSAGAIGYVPVDWVRRHALGGVPASPIALPAHRLDRAEVRAICRDPTIPVLIGYLCAMAWGGQGAGRGGPAHVARAWAAKAALVPKLTALRTGGLTRQAAYYQFHGPKAVPGLGPAYFTKLLYFFSPQPDFYIMDQWTGKSVNLLTGREVVRFAGAAVSRLNKSGNYQAYCEEVDAMSKLLGVTGEQVEEMMMSQGGHHPWPWRAYVHANWPNNAPTTRYSAAATQRSYPHIHIANF